MKNNEEDLKNKFKQALISTYKAISLDLIKSKKLNKKLKENSYNLDQFDNYNISTDFDKLRAKVDSDALRKRYSSYQIFNKYEPENNNEKKLYEISEKIRCEYIGYLKFSGIKKNLKDVKNVKRKNLVDRLILNDKRIDSIRHSINEISKFKNPLGKVLEKWTRPNKLNIKKVSTPIGVIGVIYESRPNVTADVASLSLKSGNCSILRGGSEAFNSNKLLADLFRHVLQKNNINKNCVQFIDRKDRKIVDNMLSKMSKYIDVIVPRGGKNLVRKVQKFSTVNVIGHLEGNCHVYVHKDSNIESQYQPHR